MNADDWRTNGYLSEVRSSIELWRAKKPSVISNVLSNLASPVAALVKLLIPESAIRGALMGIDWFARKTSSSTDAESGNLLDCDRRARSVRDWHTGASSLEGAAAGWLGFVSIPADIPAVIFVALRTIRGVGAQYGYADDNDLEKRFVFTVLTAAGANSQREKIEALATASIITNALTRQTWKAMAAKGALDKFGVEATVTTVRALAKQLGINLTKRKALAAIPAIGAIVGAGANAWFINEVGEAAQRMFQERWLRDRGLLLDVDIA